MLAPKVELDPMSTHAHVVFAKGCDAEGPRLLRVALRPDAEPPAVDQTRGDSRDPLAIQKVVVHVLRHRRAQVRQTLGKENQTVEFRLLLLSAKIRVVDVLFSTRRVDAGGLELGRSAARDPDVFPGRRNHERLDPLELLLVGDAISARVDVAEPPARTFASESPLPRHAPR